MTKRCGGVLFFADVDSSGSVMPSVFPSAARLTVPLQLNFSADLDRFLRLRSKRSLDVR